MIMYFREMDIRMEERNNMILSMLDNGADREFVKKVAVIDDAELDRIIASKTPEDQEAK